MFDMKARRDLPPRVFPKSGRYYLVVADGSKRVWKPLTRESEGLPAMYSALAQILTDQIADDRMPALVSAWEREVMPRHTEKTQRDDRAMGKAIADGLVEFTAGQVKTPDVIEFLSMYRDRPRTHNAYRAHLRELMRFAEEKGYREPGSNPVTAVRTMSTPARDRYITDSELRRIKVAAMYGDDGRRTRSGAMICALLDMAYLTGQRIGDLLSLEWAQVTDKGIEFKTAKTSSRVLVEWTPRLQDVAHRLRELRKKRRGFAPQVFTTQDGDAYTYWGASTAWRRARDRSGVKGCTFHDLRAKALTDKEAREGMGPARAMGGHTTETQTADYVRRKTATKTRATR
ncbi:tyrosine-type recombinase/integrase [Methylibium sp.]|uniref:tyrosine-type recombinase/integrase n=1 Tax=Methylibium sp. TaxID=2067992 RepID=UPI003D136D6E